MTDHIAPHEAGAADETIAVILAGGQARRMGGGDKGALSLVGRRLIDYVLERIRPQARHILISGPNTYGLPYHAIADREDGPLGPAGALWAIAQHLQENRSPATHILTVPVDAPFAPLDLRARLSVTDQSTIACDATGDHPTFARWRLDVMLQQLQAQPPGEGLALHVLANLCSAERVRFPDGTHFTNINAPADLEAAANLVKRGV